MATDQNNPQTSDSKQSERLLIQNTLDQVGNTVVLQGWVATKRDHGKLTFIDLRDRSGLVQCVGYQMLRDVTPESVVEIRGLVKERPEKMINPELSTGTVEVEVQSYTILNVASELPIQIDTDGLEISEEVRLKYRYLDLRRARLQNILRLRS